MLITWGTVRRGALCAAALMAMDGAARASGPVLADDFDDNVIGDLWTVLEPGPPIMSVVEQNMRLEYPATANAGSVAAAAIVGERWAIDAAENFRLRVEAHRDLPTLPGGDAGMELVLGFRFDLPNEELIDGVALYAGSDEDGPYLLYEVTRDGAVTEEGFQPFPATDISLFSWYDANVDTIFLSTVAYFDADAIPVFGMRTSSGSDRVQVGLSAFTEGVVPTIPGGNLYFDCFAIDAGLIVQLCPEDLDGSGTVDFGDILPLLAAWGPCGGCPEDIDGNGVIDFADILRMLAVWGACG